MNTQSLLFERSAEIPEGLYLELMNKLKIDFKEPLVSTKIIVVTKSLPRTVSMSKQELIQQIIKESIDWEDRENILLLITKKRTGYDEIKELCSTRKLPTMKENPRWAAQQEILTQNPEVRSFFRLPANSPNIILV